MYVRYTAHPFPFQREKEKFSGMSDIIAFHIHLIFLVYTLLAESDFVGPSLLHVYHSRYEYGHEYGHETV
jgi:hypothetical protein